MIFIADSKAKIDLRFSFPKKGKKRVSTYLAKILSLRRYRERDEADGSEQFECLLARNSRESRWFYVCFQPEVFASDETAVSVYKESAYPQYIHGLST